MNIRIIPVGAFAVNCIVLWKDPSNAWVIDPGAEPDKINRVLEENSLGVSQCLFTHGHIDHISAMDEITGLENVPVHIGAGDVQWAFSEANRIAPYFHVPAKPEGLLPDLTPDTVIEQGGIAARIIATPGHSPGGVCFCFPAENLLASGDTLFAGSVGRTDLPGGDATALTRSLKKLALLADDVRVICGHGPHTTIGREKRCNPFLKPHQGTTP